MTPLELRKKLGWSQETMAEWLCLDRSTVSRIETGSPISGPVLKLLRILEAEHEQAA